MAGREELSEMAGILTATDAEIEEYNTLRKELNGVMQKRKKQEFELEKLRTEVQNKKRVTKDEDHRAAAIQKLKNDLKTVIEPTQKKNDNRNKVNVVLKEKRELLHKVEMKNDQLKLDREIKGIDATNNFYDKKLSEAKNHLTAMRTTRDGLKSEIDALQKAYNEKSVEIITKFVLFKISNERKLALVNQKKRDLQKAEDEQRLLFQSVIRHRQESHKTESKSNRYDHNQSIYKKSIEKDQSGNRGGLSCNSEPESNNNKTTIAITVSPTQRSGPSGSNIFKTFSTPKKPVTQKKPKQKATPKIIQKAEIPKKTKSPAQQNQSDENENFQFKSPVTLKNQLKHDKPITEDVTEKSPIASDNFEFTKPGPITPSSAKNMNFDFSPKNNEPELSSRSFSFQNTPGGNKRESPSPLFGTPTSGKDFNEKKSKDDFESGFNFGNDELTFNDMPFNFGNETPIPNESPFNFSTPEATSANKDPFYQFEF